jgi:hypothetical protein
MSSHQRPGIPVAFVAAACDHQPMAQSTFGQMLTHGIVDRFWDLWDFLVRVVFRRGKESPIAEEDPNGPKRTHGAT